MLACPGEAEFAASLNEPQHTKQQSDTLIQDGASAHLVCKLFNEDQRPNEDIGILHIF